MKTAQDVLTEKNRDMISISCDATILQALQVMGKHKIGAILVTDKDKITGIWTERDLMRNIVSPDFDIETARICDYMTTRLHMAAYDDSLIKLEEMFLGLFIRHILVQREGEIIGLLSIGDILRVSLLEKDRQLKELNAIASWEYYEDWAWKRKKR